MPIWLRKFTFSQIVKHNKEQQEQIDKSSNQNSNKQTAIGADGKINPTAFQRPTKSNY